MIREASLLGKEVPNNARPHRPLNSRCSDPSCSRWAGVGAAPISTERRKQHNDVAGFIYAVLGVSYAVLLGLMLIAVWEQWNAAQDVASDEANELAGIFWFAHALPQPEGRHIQELARSYAQVVVEEEWPLMAQGRSSPKAWATLDELRGTILGLDPPTGAQQVRYNQVLEQLHGLGDARRERLLAANEGLAPILWVVLIGGGVITISFTYLFGLDNTVVHTLMVAALAMILSVVTVHCGCSGLPLQGRRAYPPCRLRAGAREV